MADLPRRPLFDPRRSPMELFEPFRRMFDTDFESSAIRVEEYTDADTLVVRAELPDVDPDKDVEVSVRDGNLHIHAQREERTEHKEKDSYRSEFHYGSFSRTVPLPEGVKEEDVKATYRNGVLEVRIPLPPKPVDAPPRKIQVTREE